MEGYQVLTLEDTLSYADIYITTTGNHNIITAEHMAKMKDKAIVGNIGHFDNEIDMAGLKKIPGVKKTNIKPQYDMWTLPGRAQSVMILAEGRLLNLGCATGHPSFVMSNSFTNQTIAQIELATNNAKYENKVYVLPKHLDEKVARLHLEKLGVQADQAHARAGRVHRRAGRRTVQERSISVLIADEVNADQRLPAWRLRSPRRFLLRVHGEPGTTSPRPCPCIFRALASRS